MDSYMVSFWISIFCCFWIIVYYRVAIYLATFFLDRYERDNQGCLLL